MTYNAETKQFGCMEFASALPGNASMNMLHEPQPAHGYDVSMTDA